MTVARHWTSAIAPDRPPVPETWHWVAGMVLAGLLLFAVGLRYAGGAIPAAGDDVEAVVVSLGAAPQRLEAPPSDVQTTDEPMVPAERADDAPPPAPPPEPRVVPAFTQGSGGSARSGTGGRPAPPPPAPPRPSPPAPPAPPAVTQVTDEFINISRRAYMAQIVYPAAALRREQSGTGVLRVTIARDGRVLEWRLVQSTGHGRLDDEIRRVADIVTRLDPLPANFSRTMAEADIPIMFVLEYVDTPQ